MNAVADLPQKKQSGTDARYMTFRVGHMLVGLSIEHLQEINRHFNVTAVPHAPAAIRGVINLRGQVVSIIDLRTVCGLPRCEVTRQSRNVIVLSQGERIGLWVDQVLDTITIHADQIEPPPANVDGVDGRYFDGVYATEDNVILLAKLDAMLELS